MLSNKYVLRSIVTVDDFLEQFDGLNLSDMQKGVLLDLEFGLGSRSQKICPIIQLAKPEDAEEITLIFKEVYRRTYPFKKMEDVQEVCKMIKDPNYKWILFKNELNVIIGCFGAQLELEKKRGYLFGFVIRKEFQNIFDTIKAYIGCVVYFWRIYANIIYVWTGEIRTNDATPQFVTNLCGLKPIGFLPNKDLFFHRIESEFLHIAYSNEVLQKYRSKKTPKIIRQVLNCFLYSNNRYRIGNPQIENPTLNFDLEKISEIKKLIIKRSEKDKFENEMITFNLKNSNSYFKFQYNALHQNVEKTTYEINNLEELFVFVLKLKEFIREHKVRYFECYISAYEPTHQKIFLNEGFTPRGYIPSWNYIKERDIFEDNILFNYFKGKFDKTLKLIPETKEFLKILKIF